MRRIAFVLLLLVARVAHPHSGPITPSRATFDPVTLAAPGFIATLSPSGSADAFHVLYDAATSTAQLCPDPGAPTDRCFLPSPARPFAGGTLGLAGFEARMLTSGDAIARAVPMTFSDGITSATIMVGLTTGLAAAGGQVVEGAPFAADGRFTLVGAVTLPDVAPPLGGTTLALSIGGIAAPPPDMDQFVVPTSTSTLSGRVTGAGVRLRATFRPGSEAPGGTPDFAAPALVRVSANGTTIASAELPTGLQPSGARTFVGETANGSARVVVKRGRGKSRLSVDIAPATVPAVTGPVTLTYQIGGLLSRVSRDFRLRGSALRAP